MDSQSSGALPIEKHAEFALHNKILIHLNLSPEGMTFAQIYDRMKADRREFSLDFIRKVTAAVFELHRENLITCDDIFAEPSNGSVREREVLYKIAHRGKIHLLGLVLMNSSTGNILDIADQENRAAHPLIPLRVGNEGVSGGCEQMRALHIEQGQDMTANGGRNQSARSCENTADSQIYKIADGYPSAIVKGGGDTAPALSLPPSIISTEMNRVSRVMNALPDECTCGRPATKVCACGKQTCSAHWYDADGNHTLSEKDGMCSECVSAVQLQTWGESRNGVTQ